MDIVNYRNSTITILELFMMTEEERLQYKGKMFCPDCEKTAHYRGPSTRGSKPCFFAFHDPNCGQRKGGSFIIYDEGKNDVNKIKISKNRVFIKFIAPKASDSPKKPHSGGTTSYGGQLKKRYQKDPPRERLGSVTALSILNMARRGVLDKQKFKVHINGLDRPISEVVHNIENKDYLEKKKHGIYWGYIKSTGKSIWINATEKHFSIILGDKIKDSFWVKNNFKDKKIPEGTPFIIQGQPFKSKNEDRYFIKATHIKQIQIPKRYKKSK